MHLATANLLSGSCLAVFSTASVAAIEKVFLFPSVSYMLVTVTLIWLVSVELSHLPGVVLQAAADVPASPA